MSFTVLSRLALPALLLVTAAGCRPDSSGDRAAADTVQLAGPLQLTEFGGRVFDIREQRGNVVMLFFGYTHCPDVCPTTMADFAGVKRTLGALAARVRFVMVTVDPARDTPEAIQQYVRAFDPGFIGLAGDSATTAQIMRGYYVAAYRDPTETPGEYTVTHSATVFVIDPEGRIAHRFGFGQGRTEQLAAAVRRLL